MDTPRSWFNLQHFKGLIDTPKDSEKELREKMSGFMASCPLEVLIDAATVVYEYRKAELNKPTNN